MVYIRTIQRRSTQLAVIVVAALSVGLSIAGIPMRQQEILKIAYLFEPNIPSWASPPVCAYFILGLEIVVAFIFFVTALVLFWHKSTSYLVLTLVITLFAMGATETSMTDALINPQYSTDWLAWRWPVWSLRALAITGGLLSLYILPDGHFTPAWTKPLALIWVGLNLIWLLFPRVPFNTIYGPTWRATPAISFLVTLAWYSTGLYAQIFRYHTVSSFTQRQQTKWITYGLVIAVMGGITYYGIWVFTNFYKPPPGIPALLYLVGRPALAGALLACLPICIGIAIFRYHLWNIDFIINRTLVYVTLTGVTMGVYVLVVVTLGEILQSGDATAPFLATGLVAILFQPIRERIQRTVNRLMYGERDTPYRVVSELGRRLEGTFEPNTVLPTVVETVAQSLKLPYAAIFLKRDGQMILAAAYPPSYISADLTGSTARSLLPLPFRVPKNMVKLPLSYQGEIIGEFHLAPRAPNEPFNPADKMLLTDLARQAGVAAHNVLLTTDLEQSRQRIVTEREVARRRLGNDLHDGLGHRLAGLLRQVNIAAALLEKDPAATHTQLTKIQTQIKAALDETRTLAHSLHPPELELLGLVGALRERVQQNSEPYKLQVVFDAPADLPALPVSVQTAAYYIALESLTNVRRHSGARHCKISLHIITTPNVSPHLIGLDTVTLALEINDDGRGLPESSGAGLGLASMQQRAEELGGQFVIRSVPGKGTDIAAYLPVQINQEE